ncbi:MAG: site-2 protease family protein [Nanoarchaeota archaeon]
MYLYRTKFGMEFIDYIGGKHKKKLKALSYVVIASGYLLMITMVYLLGQLLYFYIKSPDIIRAIKVPPLMPLIPYLPSLFKIDFLPPFYFTYWIISIAIVAIFHEFSHGIFMKFNNIKIKSTGFGFLGPFLAAFVEQDEKQMVKKSKFAQITVLSAGTFANLVLSILFFLLLAVFFVLAYAPSGAMFNTYTFGPVVISGITMVDGVSINNASSGTILTLINQNNLTNNLILGTQNNTLELTKITTKDKIYFITIDNLKEQLKLNNSFIIAYNDFPAINAGLRGSIIKINEDKVSSYIELGRVMKNYNPGETVKIKTRDGNEILEYNLVLAEESNKTSSRAVLGIGIIEQSTRLISKISDFFNFFKQPATDYQPRFNSDLVIFIYNLIWWIAIINISVALANMLPMGIFDGGRMFMLTMVAITGSKRAGEAAFRIATWIISTIFILLMLSWAVAIFF